MGSSNQSTIIIFVFCRNPRFFDLSQLPAAVVSHMVQTAKERNSFSFLEQFMSCLHVQSCRQFFPCFNALNRRANKVRTPHWYLGPVDYWSGTVAIFQRYANGLVLFVLLLILMFLFTSSYRTERFGFTRLAASGGSGVFSILTLFQC